MRWTSRGWARNMGTTELAVLDLSNISNTDYRKVWAYPAMYSDTRGVSVAWYQPMRHMGNYHMEITFPAQDVLKLFKAKFGTELGAWLVDDEGFTISEELMKRALRTVKLSEL